VKASPAASGSLTYRVQSKDTLSSIAARFHTTVAALAAANGITNTRIIHVGQMLVIP
jgi:LysM repeat protein